MNLSIDNTNLYNSFKLNFPSSYSAKNIINNYGVKVDDAILFRRLLQNKYREDLDSIISQKKKDSRNMENNDDDLSRIMKMNDRYKFEKITQQSLLKELNEYNEKEAEEKKQKMKELKESQYKEYLEKLNSINLEKEISNKINQEKKEQ